MIQQPARIGAFVEEVLRYYSPSTGVARTVIEPVEIGGVALAPGDRLLCAINSGNRDDAPFGDGEIFDMDRRRRPHLAFGWGLHACLGQNLARADLRIFLSEILLRMPDFEIDPDRVEPYASVPLVSGYAAMPMQFTPSRPKAAVRDWPLLTAPRLRPVEGRGG